MILSIFAFILVIGVVILAHELGHFITAKLTGIKVLEFGLGFPPRLFALRRGETEYSLNLLLPLGGFVRLLGEEDPSQPRSLASKGVGTRLLVLGSGALMNIILPLALFSIAFMIPRQEVVETVRIEEVAPSSPAAEAGMEPGDIILSVRGRQISNRDDMVYNIQLGLGRPTEFVLQRPDGTLKTVTVVPRWNPPPDEGWIGIELPTVLEDPKTIRRSDPFWRAVPRAWQTSTDAFILMRNEVVSWFVAGKAPEVAGPVGIFQITGEVAHLGFRALMQFAAFLSLNLAIINLLPLPALDGGRIAFVLLEWVRRGKRIAPRYERMVHLAGFMLLIALIFVVSYFDVLRIIRGEELLR